MLTVPRSFLLVTWAGGGNVAPFVCLADLLSRRGHRVGTVAPPEVHDRVAMTGADLVAAPSGFLAGASDVVAAAESFGPDVLVVDYMLTAALCGAERTGRPVVALVHTLYRALLQAGAPNPIAMAGSIEDVNDVRCALGLQPVARFGDLLGAAALVAVTAPRALDEPGDLPANVLYTGPLLECPGPDGGWEPPAGDGPLVAVSLGTAGDPKQEVAVLRSILAALDGIDVRGLVNLAPYVDRSGLDVPANVTMTGLVRHAAVLPHADLLVTHAGLGSVVAALAHGVRMVALPLAREQPDNARALARLGAGEVVEPTAPAGDIRAAILRQLNGPRLAPIKPYPGPFLDRLETLLP
jgi:UDP:flavonoid glycosyltransferase YjiC (YdhE family)